MSSADRLFKGLVFADGDLETPVSAVSLGNRSAGPAPVAGRLTSPQMNSRERSERTLSGFGKSFGELNPKRMIGCPCRIQSTSELIKMPGGLIVQKVQDF